MLSNQLREIIKTYPDFPKKGILFRDLLPIFSNPKIYSQLINEMASDSIFKQCDAILAIDARGFLLGSSIALQAFKPLILARKPGKLPAEHASVIYKLEYGTDSVELHCDPPVANHRVVIVDDLLATGGTAAATAHLVRKLGGLVVGCVFVIELLDLGGRDKLAKQPVKALIEY